MPQHSILLPLTSVLTQYCLSISVAISFSSLRGEITPDVRTTVIFVSNSVNFFNILQSFTISGKPAFSQICVSNLSQDAHSHLHRRETPLLYAIPVPKLINTRK